MTETPTPGESEMALGVDRDLAVRIYEVMVLTRAVEDRMVAMYRGGDLLGSLYTGHWHEAISVGAASCLRPDDYMAPLHRNLGAHLWKGMEPWQVMASFMGKATSPTGGRDGTLHYGRLDLGVYNPPSHIPANFPVATGMAFAAQYRGQDKVCLAFCGDGSTSRADFHESLSIASVLKLPNVFVIENNQYAYSTPLRLTSNSESFAVKAVAYGIPGVTVDGTDVLAVHGAVAEAVARARDGEGPSIIEGVTMRMHGHAEHDPADYVVKELYEEYSKKDPVELFENVLVSRGVLDADTAKKIREDARQAAIAARRKALADPMPEPSGIEDGVYAP
jgi:TPP-dependent pyruvate/acetoin dehydrogenase alpha subunit